MQISINEISSKKEDFDKNILSFILEIPDYDYLVIERLIERVKISLGENLIDFNIKNLK